MSLVRRVAIHREHAARRRHNLQGSSLLTSTWLHRNPNDPCPRVSLASLAHPHPRRLFSAQKESVEEMAKRLSDEAEAGWQASGKQSKIRMKRSTTVVTPETHTPAPTAETTITEDSTANSKQEAINDPDAPKSNTTTMSSTSAADTQPSDTDTSTAATAAPSSSFPSSSQSWSSWLFAEWSHLQEYLKRFQRSQADKKRRTADDVRERLATGLSPEQQANAAAAAAAAAKAPKDNTLHPDDDIPLHHSTPSHTVKPSAAPGSPSSSSSSTSSASSSSTTSALVLVDSSTVWDKRLERMKDSFRSSTPFIKFRKVKRTLIHSNNPILQPLHTLAHTVTETWDDMKVTWETSQHPTLFKIRDVSDKVVGETETGFALGEIMRLDSSFDMLSFVEEMEQYMIPVVVTAYLRATPNDRALLSSVCEGSARSFIRRQFAERDAKQEDYDPSILDISQVEIHSAMMIKDIPHIQVHCMIQQINCARSRNSRMVTKKNADGTETQVEEQKGTVVSGHPTDIQSHLYVMLLRRDFENVDFDWKIVDINTQKILSLGL